MMIDTANLVSGILGSLIAAAIVGVATWQWRQVRHRWPDAREFLCESLLGLSLVSACHLSTWFVMRSILSASQDWPMLWVDGNFWNPWQIFVSTGALVVVVQTAHMLVADEGRFTSKERTRVRAALTVIGLVLTLIAIPTV